MCSVIEADRRREDGFPDLSVERRRDEPLLLRSWLPSVGQSGGGGVAGGGGGGSSGGGGGGGASCAGGAGGVSVGESTRIAAMELTMSLTISMFERSI